MSREKRPLFMTAMTVFAILFYFACAERSTQPWEDGEGGDLGRSACVDCHADKDQLIAAADPDTSDHGGEGSGEG